MAIGPTEGALRRVPMDFSLPIGDDDTHSDTDLKEDLLDNVLVEGLMDRTHGLRAGRREAKSLVDCIVDRNDCTVSVGEVLRDGLRVPLWREWWIWIWGV